MSMIEWLVKKCKDKTKREEMCLSELEKEIKRRKWFFLILYCAFIFLAYLGFILLFDVSQILSLLFLSMLVGFFALITAIDYLFTRLLYYLKLNIEE